MKKITIHASLFTLVIIILFAGYLIYALALSKTTDDNYVIHNFPLMDHQFVPIKVDTRIGLDYFCTIELMDSTILVDITKEYNHFSYGIIRFETFKLLNSHDPTDWTSKDTLYHKGMKIYNIERYSLVAYINKMPFLYSE